MVLEKKKQKTKKKPSIGYYYVKRYAFLIPSIVVGDMLHMRA